MNLHQLIERYNIPVPRYTSYPPANHFTESFDTGCFEAAVEESNSFLPNHLSFYIHIPFCAQLCYYCGCNSFPMRKQAQIDRYIVALHVEMDRIIARIDSKRRIAQIHYGGGTPTVLPVSVLKELNNHLLGAFECIDRPEIAIECHPGSLDETYWQELTQAGFNRFSIGIQDFREDVLSAVNRRPALLPVETIYQILRQQGASINMDFLYGLPLQTASSFAATITQAAALQPDRLVTFSYAHVPWVNKQQLILERRGLPDGEQKNKMYALAKEILCGEGYQSIGLDHFVRADDELCTALKNKQLHRNFQGYCTKRTTGQVYAFGVTAISQLSSAYAQNSKEINTYIERIESGTLATQKGYKLTKEEQITREVIEMLMCNYSIQWGELSAQLALPIEEIKRATAYNTEKLQQLANDGLVVFDENELTVTPQGAPFVRNVAASLDKLMEHSTKSFSKPL